MFVCEARFDEAAAMDDETREMLKRLLTVVEATRTDVQALASRMDAQEAFSARQEAFNARIERELADVKSEVKFQAGVINARLDEQGRILAAMIPTRLAAVPAAE
jgi:hypothetical protein